MKATVQARRADGTYSARTENILLVFKVAGTETLALGETIEIDLPSVLSSQQVLRTKDGSVVRIQLDPDGIHDLARPATHGSSRTPTG